MHTYFEWNEIKRKTNLDKHGIDFADATKLWQEEYFELQHRSRNGEERHMIAGKLNGVIIVVVYTRRDDAVRLISARKASRSEREGYKNKGRRDHKAERPD